MSFICTHISSFQSFYVSLHCKVYTFDVEIMKKALFFSVLFLSFAFTAMAQKKTNVTVVDNGGMNESKVRLTLYDMETEELLKDDTLNFISGKVSLNVPLTNLTGLVIRSLNINDKKYEIVYVIPGKDLTATMSADGTVYSGAEVYSAMSKAFSVSKHYENQLDDISTKLRNPSNESDSVKKILKAQYDKIRAEYTQAAYDYVINNPDNDGSIFLLSECKDVEAAANMLTDRVKRGELSSLYSLIVAEAENEKERKANVVNVANGEQAPDFTLKDVNGKDVSLSSLRGKYVVIDFWGSWCIWCVRGIPKMKEMYAKYKPTGKFEILSVDCNDTDAQWREALKKYDLPWLNVYNPKGNNLPITYSVEGYPTKVIVDPKGTIVKTVVGESEAFYKYIDTLFNQK